MDLRKVKKLIELLEGSSLDEIEIREGEETVRISRRRETIVTAAPMQAVQAMAPVASAQPVASAPARATETAADDDHAVKAPMVGTFYSSSSPGSQPFVSVGARIKAGDTLCIIEAMKLMNNIECETPGVITAVHAEDGQPVEFGQPLFSIDPAG